MKYYYRVRKTLLRFFQSMWFPEPPKRKLEQKIRRKIFLKIAKEVLDTHKSTFERLAKDD